jgi:23S rRNA pseudouridine1911/1915/1917 synthase
MIKKRLNIQVLLETPQFMVIDKPGGLAVEKLAHGYPSVEEWAEHYLSNKTYQPYVGIVHRLDRPVSGVLIIAKKRSALRRLNEQFAAHTVEKVYHAIVENAPAEDEGTLTHYLIKDPLQKKAHVVSEDTPGAVRCVLKYRMMRQLPQGALLEIRPLQGRYHQIRVQLSAAGMPILGDSKYGSALSFRADSIALHAYAIRFQDPVDGKWMKVTAPGFPPGR